MAPAVQHMGQVGSLLSPFNYSRGNFSFSTDINSVSNLHPSLGRPAAVQVVVNSPLTPLHGTFLASPNSAAPFKTQAHITELPDDNMFQQGDKYSGKSRNAGAFDVDALVDGSRKTTNARKDGGQSSRQRNDSSAIEPKKKSLFSGFGTLDDPSPFDTRKNGAKGSVHGPKSSVWPSNHPFPSLEQERVESPSNSTVVTTFRLPPRTQEHDPLLPTFNGSGDLPTTPPRRADGGFWQSSRPEKRPPPDDAVEGRTLERLANPAPKAPKRPGYFQSHPLHERFAALSGIQRDGLWNKVAEDFKVQELPTFSSRDPKEIRDKVFKEYLQATSASSRSVNDLLVHVVNTHTELICKTDDTLASKRRRSEYYVKARDNMVSRSTRAANWGAKRQKLGS